MEFLDNHAEITKQELKKLKEYIIITFKEFNEEGRSPEYVIDNTRNKIWETFVTPNFIEKYRNHFNDIYNKYINSFDNYSKNVNVTKLVLINEVFDEFKKNHKRDKNPNFQYDEDFENLTFENFVISLLKLDAAKKAHYLLLNNSELYKLFYLNDYYKVFTLEKFEGHVINSDLYKKVFSKFHPDKFIPIAKEIVDDYQGLIYEIITSEEDLNPPLKKKQIKGKNIKQDFELDEQLLILNLCLVDKNSIPLTEKIKLIILIGEINDNTIFNVNPSINNLYHKVNKGVDRKGSIENKLNMIENIIIKIEPFDLNITHQRLKKHKSTLILEQNRAKKTK